MPSLEELVHIIPLGYEIDRAVKPFEKMKAHRVYLLTIQDTAKYPPELNRKQRSFDRKVKKALESKGIQVLIHYIDMLDILEVMKHTSSIIVDEKEKGNLVYINMSAAGRLTSVGTTLAGMAHDVKIYYVRADRNSSSEEEIDMHGLSICDQVKVWMLENFNIALPDRTGQEILVRLCSADYGMTTETLLQDFISEGKPGFTEDYRVLPRMERRRVQSNYLMKLNKGYLTKLESSGYIIREKTGRNTRITITDSGRYVAYISGLIPG